MLHGQPRVAREPEDEPQVGRGHRLAVLVVTLLRRHERLHAELDGARQLVARLVRVRVRVRVRARVRVRVRIRARARARARARVGLGLGLGLASVQGLG